MCAIWNLAELLFGSTRGDAAGEMQMPSVAMALLLSPREDVPCGAVKPTSQHMNGTVTHIASLDVTCDCG